MAESPYGVLARFASADDLLAAAKALRADGAPHLEAYSPYPVEGLADTLGVGSRGVALWSLASATLAGIGTFVMQWYAAVIDYPFVVGGKPLNSWPAFIPPTVAMVLLFAVLGACLGMTIGNRLPQLYHPAFNIADFADASDDGFFLLVAHQGEGDETRSEIGKRLRDLKAMIVTEVPR